MGLSVIAASGGSWTGVNPPFTLAYTVGSNGNNVIIVAFTRNRTPTTMTGGGGSAVWALSTSEAQTNEIAGIYIGANLSSGSQTFSLTTTGGFSQPLAYGLVEYSGGTSTAVTNQFNNGTGSGTSDPASTSATSGDLVVLGAVTAAAITGPTSPWTSVASGLTNAAIAYQIVSSTGTASGTFTSTTGAYGFVAGAYSAPSAQVGPFVGHIGHA